MKSGTRRQAQPSHSPLPEDEFRSRLSFFLGVSQPPSVDPETLTYEPFFGLNEKPFSLAADPRFFFTNSGHGAAFDTLVAGIKRREGILVLTGEVGTGKTTLCRAVLESLDRKTFAALVSDPFLSREDLLKTLLLDYGVVSGDEMRRGALRGASRADLSYPLTDFLASLEPIKAFAVLMIDEAQNLTADLLDEIRILSDLERSQKLLQVFLIGQPELAARLREPALRQLAQRVTVACELPPLSKDEVGLYLSHRLTVAGSDGRVSFTPTAIAELHALSDGIPRVVNILADRAMTRAAELQTMSVDVECVRFALGDDKSKAAATPSLELVHNQPETTRRRDTAIAAEPNVPEHEPTPAPEPLVTMVSGLLQEKPQAAPAPMPRAPEPRALPQPFSPPAASSGRPALAIAVAMVALAVALTVVWFWTRTPAKTTPPVEAAQPAPAPATPPAEPAAPTAASPAAAAPTADAQLAPPSRSGILAATFFTQDRTDKSLQELRDAGFKPFSVDVTLRDGRTAFAIYLGPYDDRAAAEADLARAREVPGYDAARIVPMRRPASSP